jgi:hypothetical protein
MTAPAFVVTTGRTGSTLLSVMLRSHPDILSLSEVWSVMASRALTGGPLDGRAFGHRLSRLSPVLRAMFRAGIRAGEILYEPGRHGGLALEEVPPLAIVPLPFLDEQPLALWSALRAALEERGPAPLQDHWRFLFDDLTRRFGRRQWVERSGDSLAFAGPLARMFPDARFIHLYRDGRDVALSMSAHSDFRSKVSYAAALHRFGIDLCQGAHAYGVARFHLWVEQAVAWFVPVRHLTDAAVSPEDCADYWHRSIDAGLAMLGALPAERVMPLSYEGLMLNPREELRRLMAFLGADAPSAWLEAAVRLVEAKPEKWRALPTADQARLTAACGASLARLGYPA